MITFDAVRKSFGKIEALRGVTVRIDPGEVVVVTGARGAGKSTLLQLIVGAFHPTEGTVKVDNADLRSVPPLALTLLRQRTGIVFQDRKLFTHATVFENVAYPLEVCGASDALIAKRVAHVLHSLDLEKCARTLTHDLTASEQSRTALARAFAAQPQILLLDEPMHGLSDAHVQTVLSILKEAHSKGVTVILASVEEKWADMLEARLIRLEDGSIALDRHADREEPLPAHILEEDREKADMHTRVRPRKGSRRIAVTAIRDGDSPSPL